VADDDPVMAEAARIIRDAGERRLGPTASREEALERARAAQDPAVAAVRHGLYLRDGAYLCCDRCRVADECELYRPGERCALERAYVPTRRRQIVVVLAEDGHDPDLHTSLIDSAIWSELRLARAVRYVAVHGELRRQEGDDVFGAVAARITELQRAVRQALDALNLTPAARARLAALQAGDAGANPLGAVVHELDAEAVDAEFDEEDHNG